MNSLFFWYDRKEKGIVVWKKYCHPISGLYDAVYIKIIKGRKNMEIQENRIITRIETLAAFEKEGIRMAGLTEVNATYSDWKTGRKARITAIRMTL